MGSYHLMGVLLLLFVASSRSQENPIYDEDTTSPIETDPLPSTGSPLVLQQEVETSASPKDTFVPVPMPSTGSPLVLQQELEASAPPEVTSVPVPLPSTGPPLVLKQEVETSAPPKVTSVLVATERFTSQEESNGVASTTIITKDFEVTNESSTPASAFNDPSTTLKRVDMATTTAKDEDDGSENLTDDEGTTSPSTTQNETQSRDDDVTQMDTKNGEEEDSPTTKHPGQETNNDKLNNKKKGELVLVILIGVGIVVLILVLATMVFFLLRKKKRSGSFRTQSKKNSKRDVWAGQVPELAEGRAAQDLAMAENGRAGTELETVKEEEMITFVSGEKKTDSAIEMNELGAGEKATANGGEKLGKGDTAEEKTPLLEESPKPDEQFPVPPMEQELMANGVQ
ncbi:uncharacterized protein LOC120943048 [Rana temporaria]|uniref:uncharacterized protein LOC120943048 n=1 Tax=Rana temporaria TaxID=8407 RepID=UPI001AAE0F7C|nr:uncharacterized protein LOC120943048 [Rana temporaria]